MPANSPRRLRGFPRDEYTTLAETTDRVLATQVSAWWRYRPRPRLELTPLATADLTSHGVDLTSHGPIPLATLDPHATIRLGPLAEPGKWGAAVGRRLESCAAWRTMTCGTRCPFCMAS
ncbi:MAG TPA: hypothetical protein VMV92_28450 [Streptosporangiaceae bacterium]|nr:hypothetical protein [Streptosporangiaceae bacterium]